MKKIIVCVLTVCVWACSMAPAFALLRRDFKAVEGPVVAKKEQTSQIVVRAGTEEKTFTADAGQMSSVKVGDMVLILHQQDTPVISTLIVTAPKP